MTKTSRIFRCAALALIALFALPVGVAIAATDPIITAQTTTDAGWSLITTYGWLWGGLALAFGLSQRLLRANESTHWIAHGRTLAVLTGIAGVLGAVASWHFSGTPPAGIMMTLMGAISLVWHPATVATPPAPITATPSPSTSSTSGGAALLALVVLGAGALQASCATLRPRAAAAAQAVLDCEQADLAAAAGDGLALATQAIIGTISGAGHTDTAALKGALGAIKGDGLRCAVAGAIAALASPMPAQPGAPAAAPLEVDGAELLAAFAGVRAGWGVAGVRVAGQVL